MLDEMGILMPEVGAIGTSGFIGPQLLRVVEVRPNGYRLRELETGACWGLSFADSFKPVPEGDLPLILLAYPER